MRLLKEREKEFKKQVVAEAAHQLLSSKPFEAVTMDDIARQVGCGKGTLYLYFSSKDHILSYLVARGLDSLCRDIEEQCLKNSDVLAAINSYLALQFHFFLKNNLLVSSWLRRRLTNSIPAEWAREIRHKLAYKLEMVAAVIERGIQEKLLLPLDSTELARLMDNIIRDSSLALMEGRTREGDPEKILAMMKFVLANGIVIKPVPGRGHSGG